jgi:hypothetical protein
MHLQKYKISAEILDLCRFYPYLVLQHITAQGKGFVRNYPYLVLQHITAQGKGFVRNYPYLVLLTLTLCCNTSQNTSQHKVRSYLHKSYISAISAEI